MTILSDLQTVPSRVKAICRFVANEKTISVEDLRTAIFSGTKQSDQFGPVLREVIDLKLIEKNNDDKIQLSSHIDEEEIKNDDLLLKHLEKTLLKDPLDKDQKNNEFQRVLTWFLTRSAEKEPILYHRSLLVDMEEEMNLDDRDKHVSNQDRAGLLAIWGRYFGYIEFINNKQIIPDPTRAIHRHLKLIFDSKKELTIKDFMHALGKISAVFEFGKVREEINRKLKEKPDPIYLSSSTSLALERLKLRGVLALKKTSDTKVLICNGNRISHVELIT